MDKWLIIYRAYSDVELQQELTWLRTQTRNLFNAQTEGNRSYSRSTQEVSDRLAAATQVASERVTPTESRHGVADFSNVQVR